MTTPRTIALAVVSIGLLATPAYAASAGSIEKSQTVKTYDLDLTAPTDAEIAIERMEASAKRICSSLFRERNATQSVDRADCTETALDQAVNQYGSPEMKAAYAKRT